MLILADNKQQLTMRIYFIVPLILTLMTTCGYKNETVDIIVHNAKIYTVDETFNVVEAMAIKEGLIVETGPERQIMNKYHAKKYLDAEKRAVYPGFIDAHCHFLGMGQSLQHIDLTGTSSWEEVIERTKAFALDHPGAVIQGRGWDQNDWNVQAFPTNVLLNSTFPDQVVFLKRIDGHAAIANNKALELAGIKLNQIIDGGVIQSKEGQLTGLLIDNAVELVSQAIPKLDTTQKIEALMKAEAKCFQSGLTSVSDAGLDKEDILLIDDLHMTNRLKIGIYAMISDQPENLDYFEKTGAIINPKLQVRSVKVYADGALGSRGACLNKPYTDDPTNSGLLLSDINHFEEIAAYCIRNGFQMNTHCIGDSANRIISEIYAKHLQTSNDKRWRIEHAQIVDPSDLQKFSDYTIIPSVQPTHATSDMYWAEDRLGQNRIQSAYTFKDLMNTNGMIALGTDFPVEKVNPLLTFYAAVSRKDVDGFPEDGFQSDQKLSRQEALRGMTIWAALANFEENRRGSLEVGKRADFVVLDEDIMTVPEAMITEIKVLSTFVNGENVFEK